MARVDYGYCGIDTLRHLFERKIDQQNRIFRHNTEQHQNTDENGERNRITGDVERERTAQWGKDKRPHVDERWHDPAIQQHKHGKDQQDARDYRDEEIGHQFGGHLVIAKAHAFNAGKLAIRHRF